VLARTNLTAREGRPAWGGSIAAANGFFSSIGTASNRTGPTSVSFAGETWSQYDGDLALAGTTEHVVLLIAGHGDSTALIAYLAPKESFSGDDAQYFQPMLRSFTFLK
jgi:hypothetical protein